MKKKLMKLLSKCTKKELVKIPVLKNNLLENRVAIVTGGSSGIGLSIAEEFLRSGAEVIITGRNEEKLKKACDKLKEEFDNIFAVQMDLSNIKSLEAGFNDIIGIIGNKKIDILVNNAGISNFTDFSKVTSEEWDKVIDTNLKGTYFITQKVSEYMIQNNIKGNILNITSSSSIRPALSPYMISKWGEAGFTLGAAKKLIDKGIVVNAIAPGPTATSMLLNEGEGIEHFTNPSGRHVTSQEIANLAVFLVSDMGKMIVGDTIFMTGGAGVITLDDIKY